LGKWVPHKLSEKNKNQRLSICSSLLLRYQKESFLERIIACDEKWVLYDNSRRSGEWLNKDTSPRKIPKQGINSKKIMLIVWWSMTGIIHYEFLKSGETITTEIYCRQLDTLHQKTTSIIQL
jgi:[histone H3]-lysine36 N-dimethyltransferase SETMAR